MTESPSALLRAWLRRQLSDEQDTWLVERLASVADQAAGGERSLHIALGMAPRRLGKADLALAAEDLAQAEAARPGWAPQGWSVDEAARILILLASAAGDNAFPARFRELCRSAEVSEAVAFYRGLPLYPAPESLEDQAAEGVRTNMRAIFEAVAHRNPYPREFFDENRWNQMVLKALFIGSTLYPIQGLDQRANPSLAEILRDYAHERWAAGRPVSPELWRCVGPFAQGSALADFERALASDDESERRGAALALASSPAADAKALLATAAELSSLVQGGDLSWDRLAQGH
ncbi:MAG: EboA domain-containing protein [Kiloniellales bacterium]|nr:EboA domain-containing protein [Kiloniellales bacterium]